MREITTASTINRRRKCPGSYAMESACEESSGPLADEGTLLHPFAIDPKLKRDHLTSAQQDMLLQADRGTWEFLKLAAQQIGGGGILPEPAAYKEERLPIKGPDGEYLFSGQADVAFHYPDQKAVAVLDEKLGFIDVDPASDNDQIACYGLAWADYLGAELAIVGINQPRGKKRLTIARYDKEGLDAARREIAAIFYASMEPTAPLIAGQSQCRYCRAAAAMTCPAWKERFAALATVPERDSIATLDAPELVKFFYACKAAASIRDQVNDEMRRRIEADELPGWTLEPSGETREVTDIVAAYQAFAAYFENLGGIDAARFTACTKLSLTELAEYARELTGFPQNKAKRLVAELLNPWISRKEKRPTPTQNDL